MSLFIDSGAAKTNYFIVVKVTVLVWCSYNERTNRFSVYRRLLTKRLHGKAAELCLAKNINCIYRVTTIKYIEYINSIRHVSTVCVTLLSRGVGKVLL